jgi:hypothetical protein
MGVRVVKYKKLIAVLMLVVFVFGMFDFCLIRESLAAVPLVLTSDAIIALGTACVAGGMVFTSAEDMSALITEVWNRASKGLKQKVVDSIAIGSVFLGDKWSELIGIIKEIRQEFHDSGDIISSQPWVGNYLLENKEPRNVWYKDDIGVCGEQLTFEWTVSTLKLDIVLGHSYEGHSGKVILGINADAYYYNKSKLIGGTESGAATEIYDRVYKDYKINMVLDGMTGEYGIYLRNKDGELIKTYAGSVGSIINKPLSIRYRYGHYEDASHSVYLTGTQDYVIPSTACTYDDVLDWPARPGELEQKKVGIPLELGDLLGKTANDLTYDNYIDAPGVDLGAESETGWLQNVYNGIKALPSSIAQAIAAQFAITIDIGAEFDAIMSKVRGKMVPGYEDVGDLMGDYMNDCDDCPKVYIQNVITGQDELLINWCDYEDMIIQFKRWLGGIMIVLTLAAIYRIARVKLVVD